MNVMTLAAISTGAGVGLRFILRNKAYQNNSLVSLENIGEGHDALYCIANKSACCRNPYTPRALGNWFFPNGTRVPSSGLKWDFHRTRGQMVVLLQRRRGGENGIYHCVVPDATNVIQTIYIGVYTGSPGEFPLDHGVLYSIYIGMAWFLKAILYCTHYLSLAENLNWPALPCLYACRYMLFLKYYEQKAVNKCHEPEVQLSTYILQWLLLWFSFYLCREVDS